MHKAKAINTILVNYQYNLLFFHVEFVTKDMTTDFLYYTQTTPNTIWTSRIFKTTLNITSKPLCSAMCTLAFNTCKFYVYNGTSLACYFGQLSTVTTPIVTSTPGSQTANVRLISKGEYIRQREIKVCT